MYNTWLISEKDFMLLKLITTRSYKGFQIENTNRTLYFGRIHFHDFAIMVRPLIRYFALCIVLSSPEKRNILAAVLI